MNTPAPVTAPAPILRREITEAEERAHAALGKRDALSAELRLARSAILRAGEEVAHLQRAAEVAKASALTTAEAAHHEAVIVTAAEFVRIAGTRARHLEQRIAEVVEREGEQTDAEGQARFRALSDQGVATRERAERPRRELAAIHAELDALAREADSLKHHLVQRGAWTAELDRLPSPGAREVAR